MGSPKMLLPFGDKTILETVLENVQFAGIEEILVVLGSEKEKILETIGDADFNYIFNPDYRAGMITSVKCGIKALSSGCQTAMICLGDQPMTGADIMKQLIAESLTEARGIIVPVYEDKRGHPIMVNRRYFSEIEELSGDKGLRELLPKFPDDILEIRIQKSDILRDIDTPDEYEYELNKLK
jgi:molybdenum cofactor cytidylyltransferase